MDNTRSIQVRLTELGYDPGPLDGARGRLTIAALRRFQRDRRLGVDGIAGPATRAALFEGSSGRSSAVRLSDLPWYEEARRLLGTRETAGPASNGVILDWARNLYLPYSGDDIAWCGLFVAHCIGATLPEEPLPANPLGARNWRTFGRACEPTKGCVLVFWRTSRTQSPNGHVGFYAGEDEKAFYVLGGNQSDKVSIARIEQSRLLDARLPLSAPVARREVVKLSPTTNAFDTAEA